VRRLLLAVALVALVGCGAATPPTAQRAVVAPGVRVDGVEIGGMDAAAAERIVLGLAPKLARAPRNAHVDPSTRGLVPGLDGAQLDVAATLARVLAAPRGGAVEPVVAAVPPAVDLASLAPAPIYNGPPQRSAVAFVINVAWGEQYIPGMIQILAAEHAAVTWCLVGRWAQGHPDLVRQMAAAGRPAGVAFCNHGYTDHGWALLSQAAAYASMTQADQAIAALTGSTPRYFSPHRGEWSPAVLRASRQAGHELVLWSLDTIDWKNPSPSSLRARIVGRAKAGDIVLMHPTAPTEAALAAMIQGVRGHGLTLVTLDALLSPKGGMGA